MHDKRGLYQKYHVTRADGQPVGWTFTLEEDDPLAVPALLSYARAARWAGYITLANDLEQKVIEITERYGPKTE